MFGKLNNTLGNWWGKAKSFGKKIATGLSDGIGKGLSLFKKAQSVPGLKELIKRVPILNEAAADLSALQGFVNLATG